MTRAPAGIQLGRSVRPGFLRTMEVLVAGLVLAAGWGGASLWAVRAQLAEAGLPGAGAPPPSGAPGGGTAPAIEARDAHEAAVLLLAGVLDAPDLGAAFGTVMETVPAGMRIAGIEVRATGDPHRVEAVIAAEAASATGVAGFLSALGEHPAVLGSEVISETRQTDGRAMVRITAQLDVGSGPGQAP